jgi:rhomboid protease GluP
MDDLEKIPAEESNTGPVQGNAANNFFAFFIPKPGYYSTPIIFIINVAIFLVMLVSGVDAFNPSGEDLVSWGANFRPSTLGGEYWRLLTSCFLHIGIIHIVLNMYALVSIGMLLEPIIGAKRFFILYILTGIAASLTSLYWHDKTISAGASGAIFGVYGIFAALLSTKIVNTRDHRSQLYSILIFIGYNLAYGLQGGIDNAAHIGGLVSGIIFGYGTYFILSGKVKESASNFISAIFFVMVLGFGFFVIKALPQDLPKYYKAIDEFNQLETEAIAVYSLPQNSPKMVYVDRLKDGIANWNKMNKILDEITGMDVPNKFKEKNLLLEDYVDLRLKCYELILKTLNEDTEKYGPEIQKINEDIQVKINAIKAYK